MKLKAGEPMIILTMLIIVIMLLMWLGLASLGVQFSDTIG